MDRKKISGDYYDWKITKQPERPYIHQYHQSLVLKMFLSIPDKNGKSEIGCTFSQAMERIIGLDEITKGVPKIIYLVGWQFAGHDDSYPDWSVVNEELKRDEDENGLESLRWLMKEARNYNTTVSLHINMTDAYPISPLWQTYVENDLISKRIFGQLRKTGKWNGRMAYQINYTHEWESGFAQKRIDNLVAMLDLQTAGTVHIDAFFCRSSRGHKISIAKEQEYRRKMIRYWRDLGIDVTSEFLYDELGDVDLIGLIPMVWWINQSEKDYLERPASLLTGGKPNRKYKKYKKHLHRMFGKNIHGEELWMLPKTRTEDPAWRERFIHKFCVDSLPYFYLNQLERLEIVGSGKEKRAVFSEGIVSYAKEHLITDGHWVIKRGKDVLVPNIHNPEKHLYAYSQKGYINQMWNLPKSWSDVIQVELTTVGVNSDVVIKEVTSGQLNLSLSPGQMVLIKPLKGV